MRLGRICIHDGDNDTIKAMVIALNSEFLVKKHSWSTRNNTGLKWNFGNKYFWFRNKKNKILLQKDDNFIFRISNDIIHSVKSIEGWCLFLEIASGPFNNKKTIYMIIFISIVY